MSRVGSFASLRLLIVLSMALVLPACQGGGTGSLSPPQADDVGSADEPGFHAWVENPGESIRAPAGEMRRRSWRPSICLEPNDQLSVRR